MAPIPGHLESREHDELRYRSSAWRGETTVYSPWNEGRLLYATELTSMGLEQMYENPVELKRTGPGLFGFIFDNVLR